MAKKCLFHNNCNKYVFLFMLIEWAHNLIVTSFDALMSPFATATLPLLLSSLILCADPIPPLRLASSNIWETIVVAASIEFLCCTFSRCSIAVRIPIKTLMMLWIILIKPLLNHFYLTQFIISPEIKYAEEKRGRRKRCN